MPITLATGSWPNDPNNPSFQPTQPILKGINMLENGTSHALDTASKQISDSLDQASTLAHNGVNKLMDSSQHLREYAQKAGQTTLATIRDEPVKSVLIAAATGAALMALITLATRSSHRG